MGKRAREMLFLILARLLGEWKCDVWPNKENKTLAVEVHLCSIHGLVWQQARNQFKVVTLWQHNLMSKSPI